MKKLIQSFKVILFITISITLMASECGKDEISGDSNLKIVNQCSRTLNIYFDDSKLGTVSGDEEETWDVPSGTHTVKATCYLADDFEGTYNFKDGETVVITIDLQKKKNGNGLFLESDCQNSTNH